MAFVKRAICDCCGKEFTGTVYYLQVWAEDVNGGVTMEAATQNIQTRFQSLAGDKTYCPECMSRIRKEFNF